MLTKFYCMLSKSKTNYTAEAWWAKGIRFRVHFTGQRDERG